MHKNKNQQNIVVKTNTVKIALADFPMHDLGFLHFNPYGIACI